MPFTEKIKYPVMMPIHECTILHELSDIILNYIRAFRADIAVKYTYAYCLERVGLYADFQLMNVKTSSKGRCRYRKASFIYPRNEHLFEKVLSKI